MNDPIELLVANARFCYIRKVGLTDSITIEQFEEIMRDMFSEADVIRRLYSGERVGAFFETDKLGSVA